MPVAVVTGAGQGIGRAIARRLSADGYDVVCVDHNADAARSAASEVAGQAVVADVRDEQAAADVAHSLDRCDALVNNAGIWRFTSLTETSVDQALEVLHVNVVGTLIWMKALVPVMERTAGSAIVNLASITTEATSKGIGVYPSSKAAVVSLTKIAALEYAPRGIRVNAVGPGMIVTEGSLENYGESQQQQTRGALVPLGRLGEPEDIAGAVSFLCSSDASYITGQVLWVDGGFSQAGNDYFRLAKNAAEGR
jgi:3-oxoacyl-[acyl-carrier protein] reductase